MNHEGAMQIRLCDFFVEVTHEYFLTSRLLAENMLRNWAKGCGRCRVCELNDSHRCELMVSYLILIIIKVARHFLSLPFAREQESNRKTVVDTSLV